MSAQDKLKLWFFRDLSLEQRRALYSIYGMPVEEIRTHGDEGHVFRHIVNLIKKEAE